MPEIEMEVIDYGPQEIEDVICKEFIDDIAERAEEHLERDGQIEPAFFIYTKNKKLLQLKPEIHSVEETAAVFAAIEKIYADCHAVCIVNNAFVVNIREDEVQGLSVNPEEVGQECLLIHLKTRDGRFWLRQRTYYRDRIDGKEVVIFDTDIEQGSYKDPGTEFISNVLDPWRESGPAPVR